MSSVWLRNSVLVGGLSLLAVAACGSEDDKRAMPSSDAGEASIDASSGAASGGDGGGPSNSAGSPSHEGGVSAGGVAATDANGGAPPTEGGHANGGDAVGGAGGSSEVCPGIDTSNSPDTDGDGIPDVCDDDDDNDGFRDTDDPAPLDSAAPGDYSTPAKILSNAGVQAALAAAKAKGLTVATHEELTAPDITGYYVLGLGAGVYAATSNGANVGGQRIGYELRYTAHPDSTVDSASVGFINSPGNFELAQGQLLRGAADEITIYARVKSVCTEAAGTFAIYSLAIISASIDPQTKSLTKHVEIGVDVMTEGSNATTCQNNYVANFKTVGGWYVVSTPAATKTPLTSLKYLCVDEGNGYVPTETWTRADNSACQCTTGYAVSCQ